MSKVAKWVFGLVVLLAATLVPVVSAFYIDKTDKELNRYRANQEQLLRQRDKDIENILALELEANEYKVALEESEGLRAQQAEMIKGLRLKLSRLDAVSTTVTATSLDTVAVFVRDSTWLPELEGERLRGEIEWSDSWTDLRVSVADDSARVALSSRDTLIQVVHRVPKYFLCIPYGVKGIRQEIRSTNPHTTIVYSEYIDLKK